MHARSRSCVHGKCVECTVPFKRLYGFVLYHALIIHEQRTDARPYTVEFI